MFFKSQPAVGLDVGSSAVKVIQLKRSGAGVEVEKFGTAAVQPMGDTAEDFRLARIEAIKQALASAQITAKQAVTSVNGEAIIVRYLQLPDMPEDELRSALRFEAEEYIPFNIDDVYLDSETLGHIHDETGTSKVDVLLVSARKDMINDHADMVRAAGIQPSVVDVDSFAFFNCFEMNYQPESSEVIALVNMGAQVTNINVYSEGTSRFSRDIAIAGDSITSGIMQRLDMDFETAEQLKMQESLLDTSISSSTPEGVAESDTSFIDSLRGSVERLTGEEAIDDSPETLASQAAKEVINGLIVEIRRSLQFYENQPRSNPVERVILGGGAARMFKMVDLFASELGIPVEPFDPLLRIAPSGRNLDTITLSDNKLALGVSIGLALRKLGG